MGVFGDFGAGKTLLCSYIALETMRRRPNQKVFSNFGLKGAELVEPGDLIDFEKDESLFVLDEIYAWAESRISSSKVNRYLSYLVFQSRKRKWDIVYTAQLSSSVDLRFEQLTHLPCLALSRLGKPVDSPFKYKFLVEGNIVSREYDYDRAKKVFGLYNTNQVIKPLGLNDLQIEMEKLNGKSLSLRVDKTVSILESKYKFEYWNRDLVLDCLLREGLPLSLAPFCVARLRTSKKNKDKGFEWFGRH